MTAGRKDGFGANNMTCLKISIAYHPVDTVYPN